MWRRVQGFSVVLEVVSMLLGGAGNRKVADFAGGMFVLPEKSASHA